MDDREKLQMMIDRVAKNDGMLIEFPLLSDPDHRIIDRYGLFNPDDAKMRPMPHPHDARHRQTGCRTLEVR